MAEKGGFEPPVEYNPYVGLANRCLQPLGHLSILISHILRIKDYKNTKNLINNNKINYFLERILFES